MSAGTLFCKNTKWKTPTFVKIQGFDPNHFPVLINSAVLHHQHWPKNHKIQNYCYDAMKKIIKFQTTYIYTKINQNTVNEVVCYLATNWGWRHRSNNCESEWQGNSPLADKKYRKCMISLPKENCTVIPQPQMIFSFLFSTASKARVVTGVHKPFLYHIIRTRIWICQ